MENHLDHGHLISAIDGLFRKEPEEIQHSLDREIVSRLTRSSFTSPPTTGTAISLSARVGRESDWEETCQTLNHSLGFTRNRYEIPAPGARLRSGLVLHAFPNFGLYIFRSEKLFLSIRCGPVGQGGNGGHAHNDQLAVELTIEGVDLIRDPGSYLYTPLPAKRNAYRSTRAHFVPRLDGAEPNSLDDGLFSMPDHAHPQCLYFGESGFIGKHDGFGCPVYRLVKIRDDGVTIDDFLEGARSLVRLNPEGFPQDLPFSPGYGLQLRLAGEPAVGFPHKGR